MRNRSSLPAGLAGDEVSLKAPRATHELGPAAGLRRQLGDWLTLVWALWWLWVYVQSAVAERFPQALGWTRRLW